jgi:hypothetical protein
MRPVLSAGNQLLAKAVTSMARLPWRERTGPEVDSAVARPERRSGEIIQQIISWEITRTRRITFSSSRTLLATAFSGFIALKRSSCRNLLFHSQFLQEIAYQERDIGSLAQRRDVDSNHVER